MPVRRGGGWPATHDRELLAEMDSIDP